MLFFNLMNLTHKKAVFRIYVDQTNKIVLPISYTSHIVNKKIESQAYVSRDHTFPITESINMLTTLFLIGTVTNNFF